MKTPRPPRARITLRIPEDLAEWAEKEGERRERSVNYVLTEIIQTAKDAATAGELDSEGSGD